MFTLCILEKNPLAKSEVLDKMQHNAAFYQALYYLLRLKQFARINT